MGYTIKKILEAFLRKSPETLSTQSNSFSLRYGNLYSYGEKIGYYIGDDIHVLNKTAKGYGFYSMTTSNHVNKLLNILMAKEKTFTIHNKYEEDTEDEEDVDAFIL